MAVTGWACAAVQQQSALGNNGLFLLVVCATHERR